MLATAGGDSVGRGETLTHVHASELAFWPKSTAAEIYNGLMQAVPNTKGTAVFIESTANGVTGVFYDLWKGAVEGTNGYVPVFIPWYVDPEYREPVPANFEPTPDEEDLIEKYGLDNEQLMFRRRKVAQNGLDLWNQEYPAEPEQAFLTTGRPVFNPEQLQECIEDARDPEERLALEADEWVSPPAWRADHLQKTRPRRTICRGSGRGYGGHQWRLLGRSGTRLQKRQVATWRGQVHPDYFAEVLYALGMEYNEALVIVENNSHGILTCTRLGKDMAYPAFFTEVQYDKITDRETVKLGFTTTAKTKPLIIDQLRASMREGELEINDKTTLERCSPTSSVTPALWKRSQAVSTTASCHWHWPITSMREPGNQ